MKECHTLTFNLLNKKRSDSILIDHLGLIWLLIIAFGLLMYVILDGFAIGVGIIFPVLNDHEKDLAISTLLPTWDGNQTWLVFSLAVFYGMFPIGFAFLFSKIYLPAIFLALMLLFRGICFEFRLKSTKGVKNWDKLFFIASFFIACIHGYLAGQLIIGYSSEHYSNGLFFKICTSFVLVIGYIVLGSTRLILKTQESLLKKAYSISRIFILFLIIGMIIIVIMTSIYRSIPNWNSEKFVILTLLLSLTTIGFLLVIIVLYRKNSSHLLPYWLTVIIFIFTYISMLIYIFPYIVPYELTFDQAKANDTTLMFTLIPAAFMIPLLLIYTSYAYYIFRGKVKEKIKY